MQLKEGKTYQITELDYVFNITLLRLPNKNNTFYQWIYQNGREFSNRQQDVDRWINWGLIKEV